MAGRDAFDALRAMLQVDELEDLKAIAAQVKDPTTVGLMIALLIEERRKTNQLLQKILEKLERLEISKEKELTDLSEADERIIELIRERGMVTAEDVKEALGYKGLNGASARLNALYKRGILKKVRKGRKVYFALA
ncbi:MAG: hypothetical protein GXO00_01300 [Candidatus Diapherotrites archaeon]|nr:hypothetical protein [Candidatus Diapherotrites archaeon]